MNAQSGHKPKLHCCIRKNFFGFTRATHAPARTHTKRTAKKCGAKDWWAEDATVAAAAGATCGAREI
jgi:hypothetical protein